LLFSGFWVDASDIGRQPGDFYWTGGMKVDQFFWGGIDPNQFGQGLETCADIYSVNGKMYDWPCSEKLSYICELPKQDQICLKQ